MTSSAEQRTAVPVAPRADMPARVEGLQAERAGRATAGDQCLGPGHEVPRVRRGDLDHEHLVGIDLAGIVLGAIGALDDVTVTQASAVWEVRAANPSLDSGALFESGLRVGRDHIVSTVNTLLLAYAGASLPLLVFLSLSEQSFGFVTSSEVVAVEIVRTLVGSMGLVAAVPLTTWLAARVAANAEIDETSPRISP